MNLLPPELTVRSFRCPFCRAVTSARQTSCTRCAQPFSEEMVRSAIRHEARQEIERKIHAHRNSMLWGIVWIAIGGFLTTQLPFCLVTLFCFLVGAIQTVRGLFRYIKEQDNLRNF